MLNATPNAIKMKVFNGEDGEFPFFKIKFTAAVYGLGHHYHSALNGLAPYDQCTYSNEQVGLTPYKTPAKSRFTSVDASLAAARSPRRTNGRESKASDQLSTVAEEPTAAEHLENYHQISRKIYSILVCHLGEVPIKQLVNAGMVEGDGIGAWKLLCTEYESTSSVNQRQLFRKLIDLKMEGKQAKLHEYLYEFRRISTSLHGTARRTPR